MYVCVRMHVCAYAFSRACVCVCVCVVSMGGVCAGLHVHVCVNCNIHNFEVYIS